MWSFKEKKIEIVLNVVLICGVVTSRSDEKEGKYFSRRFNSDSFLFCFDIFPLKICITQIESGTMIFCAYRMALYGLLGLQMNEKKHIHII